jgi:hypothetical protein
LLPIGLNVKVQRTPLSRQRNKHLRTILIEAATMPELPRWRCFHGRETCRSVLVVAGK